jgi:tRNA dimethylallyltransferase
LKKQTLIIIAGPTASGKTSLAIDIAKHFNTVIISADSRQFYKEISIGTAKPTIQELNSVQHYFINSHSITEPVNSGDYILLATDLLNKLFLTNPVVVMAGGSGLYIDGVINGMDELPSASPPIRAELETIFNSSGILALQELLKEKDPVSYSKLDIQNPRRIIRALEVTLNTGIPYSSLKGNKKTQHNFKIVMLGIDWPRQELYDRINARVDQMISEGLEEEVKNVIEFRNLNALSTVGYKEMFDYIDNKITLPEAIELIKKNTRNYAKRQMTWFRKYPEMIWLKPEVQMNASVFLDSIIKKGIIA